MSESSHVVEDMEESLQKERQSYFSEPVYGPVPPSKTSSDLGAIIELLLELINNSLSIFFELAMTALTVKFYRYSCRRVKLQF